MLTFREILQILRDEWRALTVTCDNSKPLYLSHRTRVKHLHTDESQVQSSDWGDNFSFKPN